MPCVSMGWAFLFATFFVLWRDKLFNNIGSSGVNLSVVHV